MNGVYTRTLSTALCTLFLLIITISRNSQTTPIPIQFSIPEMKIVKEVARKKRDFAFIIPGDLNTYIYNSEPRYYQDYQRSYFAITRAKGGWDCMRHYEILANGCIPYFIDIDKCNPNTMYFLPKELIKEAMNLDGVPYLQEEDTHNPANLKINYKKFNRKKYYEILHKLLAHTRQYLTTKSMAAYLLTTINYSGNGNILFLSNEVSPDYLRECTLIGLKELFHEKIVDIPKIDYLYTNYSGDIQKLYGKGISYTKIIEDLPVDRNRIEDRIKNKEFDLIIYGSVHRGLRFHDLVRENYPQEKIVYICGEDNHRCEFANWHNLFLREFDAHC